MSVARLRFVGLGLLTLLLAAGAWASDVGRRFPVEKRSLTDAVTGVRLEALTTDPASDAKPYQTHPAWTADGQWILFRSDRGGSGPQAFIVHEQRGDIIQLTDGPANQMGSLNLSRKSNKLFFMRGGPSRRPAGAASVSPPAPRQLVELRLDPLIADAMAGTPREASEYERVVATLPNELRDAGGFALDADETRAYWGVSWGALPERRPAALADGSGAPEARREIDDRNMDPSEGRESARLRFEAAGQGQGGIRGIDLRTGEIRTVIDVPFRMGHVQANPWVPGEIVYCHETTGDARQRIWTVRADGSGNRPVYVETPDEWVTHETVASADELMFNLMGHLPYLRERPTGLAVVNLRTSRMLVLGQVDEDMGEGRTGGLWHGNGSPDGRWAIADSFKGDVYLIDRRSGERILLSVDHKMRPDHAHPIFSPDSKRVLIQSGRLTDGKSLDLMIVEIPGALLDG